jgi:hypothetical protein
MALLDLKEKKDWADFASKESISVDSNGCIDAKETQVRRAPLGFESLPCASVDQRISAASTACKAGGDRGK